MNFDLYSDDALISIIDANDLKALDQYLSDPKNFLHFKIRDGEYRYSTPAHYAAALGKPEIVKALIKKGLDIDCVDQEGFTPLVRAIDRFKPERSDDYEAVVDLLIRAGADVNHEDDSELTAAHYAAKSGSKFILDRLIEENADLHAKDGYEETPLHNAAAKGHEPIVRALIQAGADVNAAEMNRWTALQYAAWNGHESIVKTLIHAGADIDANNGHGETALHHAAWHGHESIVKTLIQAGSCLDSRDDSGWTPFLLSVWHGHEPIVKTLIHAGAECTPDDLKKLIETGISDNIVDLINAEIAARELSGLSDANLDNPHDGGEQASAPKPMRL